MTLVFLQAWFGAFTGDATIDSYSYYYAAEALARQENPYDTATLQRLAPDELGFVFPYLYPPVVALAWRALLPLGPTLAHHTTIVAGVILAAINALLLWRLVRPEKNRGLGWIAFCALHAVCGPLVSTLRLGQVNVVVVALVLLALHAERKDRPVGAGLLLAIAILVKITPAVFLVDLFLRSRWRTLFATVGWAGMLVAASAVVTGIQPWLDFAVRVRDPLPFNPPMSLRGLVELAALPLGLGPLPRALAFLALASFVIVRIVRRLVEAPADPVRGWSMLAIGSLLLFPLTWHHHYVLALLPFSFFAFRAFESDQPKRGGFWVLLAACTLLRYPGVLHPLKPVASFLAVILF